MSKKDEWTNVDEILDWLHRIDIKELSDESRILLKTIFQLEKERDDYKRNNNLLMQFIKNHKLIYVYGKWRKRNG